MALTPSMLLIVCPLVFLAAFIDSIAGGGGLISLPAYYLAGLPPVLAAGTNKLSAMLGTGVSTAQYAKSKCIAWKEALCAAAGAVPGSILGARLLERVPQNTARWIVVCALPVIAFFVLRKKDGLVSRQLVPKRLAPLVCVAIGLVMGLYDGLIGPGTGTFLILLFVGVIGMEGLKAIGCARLVNLSSNVGALAAMISGGHVLYGLGLIAAVFAMAGNYLGARCAMRGGAKLVRKLLLLVLALIFAKLLFDLLS
jgi:uncharacterized membrane protein YfcA